MPTVEPAYDPKTRTWFTEDPCVEAPTLRALMEALNGIGGSRKKWVIEGYYPLGVGIRYGGGIKLEKCTEQKAIAIPATSPARKKLDHAPAVAAPSAPKEPPPRRVRGPIVRKFERRHKFRSWDPALYEKVLDMWAAGVKGWIIAQKLGLTAVQVCSHMVPNARAHGDPRAVVRSSHCGVKRGGDQAPADKCPGTSGLPG